MYFTPHIDLHQISCILSDNYGIIIFLGGSMKTEMDIQERIDGCKDEVVNISEENKAKGYLEHLKSTILALEWIIEEDDFESPKP